MKRRLTSVALASMVFASSTLNIVSADSTETKKHLESIKENKKKVEGAISKAGKDVKDVNNSMSNITDELSDILNKKIANEKKLIDIQESLNKEMDYLKDHIAKYYINSFNSNTSILENLVKSESTSDFIVKSTYVKYIIDNKDNKIKLVEDLLIKQNEILREIESSEEELVDIKENLAKKKSKLEKTLEYNKNTLKDLNKKQSELEDILEVQEKEEAAIKAEINDAISLNENKDSQSISNTSDNSDIEVPINKNDDNNSIQQSKPDISLDSDSNINKVNRKGFSSPLKSYRITSKFGYRTHPVTGEYKMHNGIDLAAPKGTDITSVKDGEVVISKYSSSYGNYVVVNHDNGISSLYAHLDKRLVSVGDKVSTGDKIGLLGSTGMSTGPHLHFEIRLNGEHVNPTLYISF